MSRPATLGQLRESGWESVPVKEEVRRNAIAKVQAGDPLFPGVLGFDETVFPQLENALLAGHDVIFLGERGQAGGVAWWAHVGGFLFGFVTSVFAQKEALERVPPRFIDV